MIGHYITDNKCIIMTSIIGRRSKERKEYFFTSEQEYLK